MTVCRITIAATAGIEVTIVEEDIDSAVLSVDTAQLLQLLQRNGSDMTNQLAEVTSKVRNLLIYTSYHFLTIFSAK
jgi:hypothetical protein